MDDQKGAIDKLRNVFSSDDEEVDIATAEGDEESRELWVKCWDAVQQKIEGASVKLYQLSHEIWSNPELDFQEKHAHGCLTAFLEEEGFEVTRNYHLDTAFKASYGSFKGVHVCVICEYDALPGIGHACGHNLIAEIGVAAGLGIKAALDLPEDMQLGRVTVMGTPAEEGGGGKIKLIEAGAFKGMDVALMAHPFPSNMSRPICLASVDMNVTFTGRSSHAAAAPWDGVNALDAGITFYNNIALMRQQFKPDWRVQVGFMKAGGGTPSIIPESSEMVLNVRTADSADLPTLKKKIIACANGAATSTGCKVEYSFGLKYANLITNPTLASIYERRAAVLGIDLSSNDVTFSTDMGDVSYEVPSIHTMYSIGTTEPNHSRGFNEAAGSPDAQPPTLLQAKALALTALELMQPSKTALMDKIRKEFQAEVAPKKKVQMQMQEANGDL